MRQTLEEMRAFIGWDVVVIQDWTDDRARQQGRLLAVHDDGETIVNDDGVTYYCWPTLHIIALEKS